jgi:hypothetical protein
LWLGFDDATGGFEEQPLVNRANAGRLLLADEFV